MKLIKQQHKFILVSNEELIKGDKAFDTTTDNGIYSSVLRTAKDSYWNKLKLPKIIAGTPELPIVDFSLLKEKDCLEIGYVNVEKLAENKYPSDVHDFTDGGFDTKEVTRLAFIDDFTTAQSLNDKCFSLEDMELYTQWCSDKGYSYDASFGWEHPSGHRPNNSELIREYAQSLQQTSWDVEVEMELIQSIKRGVGKYNHPERYIWKPKITNNSIKITKIL